MITSEKLENTSIRTKPSSRLNMFNAADVVLMSSKNTANCESNTNCVSSSSPNTKCAMSDDLHTNYEEIDTTYGEPSINRNTFDNPNITIIANDNNITYEKIITATDELNCSYDILTNSQNESKATCEDVDTVHDEYDVPDTPPPPGQQVDAVAIHNAAFLPQSPDEPNSPYAEYDEIDTQSPPGVQVNAAAIYNSSLPRIAADTRRPALPCPADSDQDYAEATHSGIASWWTKKRIQISANSVLGLTIFIVALVLILKRNVPEPILTNQPIDTVFRVNQSTKDYRVTFVDNFPVNIHNETNYTFHVAQGLVTLEININANNAMLIKGLVVVSIKMLTGQQKKVDLVATYSNTTGDGVWNIILSVSSAVLANDTSLHLFLIRNHTRNNANKTLDDSGIYTIRMTGSYLIHSQRTIATSRAKFNPDENTSVTMSYTWTVCNLTLPMVDYSYLKSEDLFTELGVAEFYIEMYLNENFVSMYSYLANIPPNITLPFQVRHTSELINSSSPTLAVVDQHRTIQIYQYVDSPQMSSEHKFKYADFVNSMLQQCVTLKHHVEYYRQL